VQAAARALSNEDAETVGKLMFASHESLAKDYEVSCPELDALVAAAKRSPGCIGARVTGAGFGGNTVNLVRRAEVDAFITALEAGYNERTGRHAKARLVRPDRGVHVETLRDTD
jgi:galactokinase